MDFLKEEIYSNHISELAVLELLSLKAWKRLYPLNNEPA